MTPPALDGLTVFERGWLSSNNLLLHGGALGHGDTAHGRIAGTGGRADQDGGENGRHGRYALAAG